MRSLLLASAIDGTLRLTDLSGWALSAEETEAIVGGNATHSTGGARRHAPGRSPFRSELAGPWNRVRRRRSGPFVVMSRLDYEVKVLAIPPVSAREERALIGYRLRALHPGDPADTVFDYRTAETPDGARRAAVYLMRREIFEAYRGLAERGALVSFDLILAHEKRALDAVVLVRRVDYTERLLFRRGALLESTLRDRQELQDTAAAPTGGGDPENCICITEGAGPPSVTDRSSAVVPAGCDPAPTEQLKFADLASGRPRRRTVPLFLPERRRPKVGPLAAAATLALCAAALLIAFGVRTVDSYRTRLADVKSRYQAVMVRYAGQARDAQSFLASREKLQALLSARPLDTYGFLASLAAVFDGDRHTPHGVTVVVESVTMSGGSFSVEARGGEPFRMAEALSTRRGFHAVRVAQIVPDDRGTSVHFTLTGKYDGR
ncbi:hypothetical protein [Salinispira pacifica]